MSLEEITENLGLDLVNTNRMLPYDLAFRSSLHYIFDTPCLSRAYATYETCHTP